MTPGDPTGAVLVMTVWREDDELRARLRFTRDCGDAAVLTIAGTGRILDEVRRWLQSVDAAQPPR